MSRLTDLIAQAKARDPQLGEDLESEFKALSERRAFGLNFERHQPEAVELPNRTVRRGDKVRVLPPRGSREATPELLWVVNRLELVDGVRVARLEAVEPSGEPLMEGEPLVVPVADLVVVAQFRDVIYPGLVSTGRLPNGGDGPWHTVVNAENYHALRTLTYTHRGRVDLIYIDPPYNTGNDDWVYNDRHMTTDDLYRHSKWLAFMERRLLLAKALLTETGVIIVAIGDDEHHRLRMLMDQVFGEQNFISDVVWQGGRKNDSRYVSNGADYMLIYAKEETTLAAKGVRWREAKPGASQALEEAARIWQECEGVWSDANQRWRSWLKEFKKSGTASDAVTRFSALSPDGRPMRADRDLRSPSLRPNLQYDLLHPITGLPVKRHANGWAHSREVMQVLVDEGRVRFGSDHNAGAAGVDYLDEQVTQVASSVFERNRNTSGIRLSKMLGSRRFPNPKDHEILVRWLGLVAGCDATVLDFFGGSGSTLEAVMRLNAQDGGTRKCVLVTNNEVGAKKTRDMRRAGLRDGDPEWEANGVHEYVTKPRITTVVTGVRPDGSAYDDRVDANVEFFDLTYETPVAVSHNLAFARIAPLLWMRAGARGSRIDAIPVAGWEVADTYGLIVDLDQAAAFCAAVEEAEGMRTAFVVTDDDRRFQAVARRLPDSVEPVRLWESYLSNFRFSNGD